MMIKFYAVDWQLPKKGSSTGKAKNIREAMFKNDNELDNFVNNIKFDACASGNNDDLQKKFRNAISNLENVETNGNNTDIPFYREKSHFNTCELERIDDITNKLNDNITPLTNLDNIRFYILLIQCDNTTYRLYIKALRTAKLNTRFIMSQIDGKINITDTKKDGKVLPYNICYAEKIAEENIIQYVFNVLDYETIFGINDSKIRMAKEKFNCFFKKPNDEMPKYSISGDYHVKVSETEKDNIFKKISENRKIANLLSKYEGEANYYNIEDVKQANELSKEFMQTPFSFDDANHKIEVTASSLDAFVSVISNTKKLGIAKHEYEDSLASKRTTKK